MPRIRTREPETLEVKNFAQIRSARIEFGDLTVLVGPQGTGKSLLLQLWKLGLDYDEIIPTLREAEHDVESVGDLLELYFGQGMRNVWRAETRVALGGKECDPEQMVRHSPGRRSRRGRVFFIPAHRALLLAEGWPAPFRKLSAEMPTVARLFSDHLRSIWDVRPLAVRENLNATYNDLVDRVIFHGGNVYIARRGEQLKRRVELQFRSSRLPFMTWTAGQREFTPLLFGLLALMPRQEQRLGMVKWVVIEEPEMGLHPQAVSVVMLMVIDLLRRGYRVILSTHAPFVLDIVFTLRRLQQLKADPALLCRAFDVKPDEEVLAGMRVALKKSYRTFYLGFKREAVHSKDISELDPSSPDESQSSWGGLTGFSSRFNHVVAEAINAAQAEEE